MTHIKNYMFIQKIRYGDRLQVFYNIDVDAAHVHIPRFILQPIVENAISHGLSNLTSVGTLEVSAFEKKDRLYIEIEDDGEGMVREKVAEITRFINTVTSTRESNWLMEKHMELPSGALHIREAALRSNCQS